MIKKVLLGIGVGLLSFIGFSYGIVIPVNTSTTNNGSVITCDDSFNCISSFNDTSHTGLYISSPSSYIGNVFWNTDNHLSYIFGYTSNNGLTQQIYSGNLSTTSYTGSLGYTNSVCDYLPGRGNLLYDSWIENYEGLPIISYTVNGYANNGCICANYGTGINSVCFHIYGYQNNWFNYDFGITGPISLEKLDNITYGNSPRISGGGGGGVDIISLNADLDEVISYYETRYNWNESMCYVGTFDTGSSFGTAGIDFVSGTGNSLFGLYYSLYNSYGNNIIKNVGSWINVRLINYSERFYNNDNIRYLANYNGPDTNISLYYTGLSFPFANKPVALYFMSSNLYDGYSREATQGEEMAYYCYVKLNYSQIQSGTINFDTVKDMVSSGINERIDDYYWSQINRINTGVRLEPNGDYWTNLLTGSDNFDLDLDSVFTDYFGKITSYFSNFSVSHSVGILPDYIVYALIFLILFRIMKH